MLGLTKIFYKARVPNNIPVLYFDMGTHREGKELALMVNTILPNICDHFEAYGFEANHDSYEQVKNRLSKNKHVSLFHKALCYTFPVNGKTRLYHSDCSGFEDSLYRKGPSYEEVEAIKISDWLHKNHIILKDKICLLRMNIEGSEYDVIQDLVENGLDKHIDGYYGMWDDLSKIDRQRDKDFRAFLSKNRICPFTFNGRDFGLSFRIRCIKYDINTHVQAGLLKLARES